MFWGALLFGLLFVMIAEPSRVFVIGLCMRASASLEAWAPSSYYVLGALAAVLLGSIVILKTWPQRANTGNPMAKFNRQVRIED